MIKRKLFRYIIPFLYDRRDSSFQKALGTLWEPCNLLSGECDLYGYVAKLVSCTDTEPNNEGAIGVSLRLKRNHIRTVLRLGRERCRTVLKDNREVSWRFADVGLFLFQSGVGFLWYETELGDKQQIDAEMLLEFLYDMKEVSYSVKAGKSRGIYVQIKEEMTAEDFRRQKAEAEQCGRTLEGYPISGKPGMMVVNRELPVDFYRDVVARFLDGIPVTSYFSERRTWEGERKPDRALLFSWLCRVREERDNGSLIFRLAHGYYEGYQAPERFLSQLSEYIYEPFQESRWYACQEGCANLVELSEPKAFYENGYQKRVDTYFYLYILVLSQYYGLLGHAEQIAALPNSREVYRKGRKMEQVQEYLENVQLFYMKNIFSQVSHFSHQNRFYGYLQDVMSVEKVNRELSMELEAVHQILKERREELQGRRLRLFSIVSAIFVIIQVFSSVHQVVDNLAGGAAVWDKVAVDLVVIAASAVIGFLGWLIIRNR